MAESMRWVGLDVHARQTVATVVCPGTGEIEQRRIEGRPLAVVDWLVDLPRPLRAVYEAGPTGYVLARAAAARGLDVAVCAPGHIGRHPSDRIKTDARDSLRLARLYAAGELKLVRVPGVEEEQLRDLVGLSDSLCRRGLVLSGCRRFRPGGPGAAGRLGKETRP